MEKCLSKRGSNLISQDRGFNLLILTQKIDINDDVLGFMHGWTKEFAKHCEKVTVIALCVGEYDLPQNVKVLSLGKKNQFQITNYIMPFGCKLQIINRIKRIIKFYSYIWQERKNYDSVFVHMNQIYVILGGVFWRVWRKRIALWYTHKQISLSLRIAEKFVDTIFTASKESFRLATKKLKVMGHGINTDIFKPAEEKKQNDKFTILTVGRVSPIKDVKTIVKAAAMLEDKNVELQIVGIAGTKEQEKYFGEVKELVKDLGIEDKVNFAGSVPNREVLKYYQGADLFINMSQTGSLDKAVLEAMACEVPVVTCNEALADSLGDYEDKLMCEKGSVDSLAGRINYILNLDAEERKGMKNDLRSVVVEGNNLGVLIKKILKIFDGKTG